MKNPKIKVHCLAIVDKAITPHAVLVADVRYPRSAPVRYVLLDNTLRFALSALAKDVGREWGYYGNLRPDGGMPLLLKTSTFDASGTVLADKPFGARTERWTNASPAWIYAGAIAPYVDNDFAAWREMNPPHAGAIWVTSWNTLVAVQSICLAAGLRAPTAQDTPESESARLGVSRTA